VDAFIISSATDTNGGNARFVRAAQKHGHDVLRAFAIGNQDPAGVVSRFQAAAERSLELRIRSAHRTSAYMAFPGDIEWTTNSEPEIRRLIQRADVVHLNNTYRAAQKFGVFRKALLLHYHGTLFRQKPEEFLGLARHHKAAQAVSTVDLLQYDPDNVVRWLPSPYDIDELQAIRQANRREPDGRVRIVHCPTGAPNGKATNELVAAVDVLKKKYPIDLVVIRDATNAEVLREKAKSDILFDQLAYGYGCNGIEAWGLGLPVIAGGEPWTIHKMKEMWGSLPFAEATEKTLPGVIEELVASADARAEYAERGMVHVRTYHDEKPALEVLIELYYEAMQKKYRPRIHGKGVLFQYANRRPHIVTDVQEVARLRVQAKMRPRFVKEIEDEAV
jgi:hypothetical protein